MSLLLAIAACQSAGTIARCNEPDEVALWVEEIGGSVDRGEHGIIRGIDLARTWVSEVDLTRLEGLPDLEHLSLAQTHVPDTSLAVVSKLPSLRSLDLFFCEHITDTGASALRAAPGLEELNLRGTKISDSGVQFLTELKNLRTLDVGIAEISDATIELLSDLPRLESLAIGGNRIGEPGIASLRALRALRHLDLSGAQITDSGIWAVQITDLNLDEIGALTQLETLNLSAPSPEYVDAVSSGVPRLRGAIRVTDLGAEQLAHLASLQKLNVSRSQLTRQGIEGLQGLIQLEDLNLAHSKTIDDEAGDALAKLPALRVLDVSFTDFGAVGLQALANHPTLDTVIAVGTLIGDSAVEAFVGSRDGRRVIR